MAAETSEKHLQNRVSDLTKQLQACEEKLIVYERRGSLHGAMEDTSSELSKEQQLQSEVAGLRCCIITNSMWLLYAHETF